MSATTDQAGRQYRGTCGFTLVEVLVILGILSLMAGLVFPSVERALQRQAFVDSARRVELGLRSARAAAIAGGTPVHFTIARDRHGFSIGDRSEQLPQTTTVRTSDQDILFFADGSAIGSEVEVVDGHYLQSIVIRSALGTIERKQ